MKHNRRYLCQNLIILSCILSGIASITTVAETWYLGKVVDFLTAGRKNITVPIICIILMVVIEYAVNTCNNYLRGYSVNKSSRNLRNLLQKKILSVAYGDIIKKQTGDILSVYRSDIEQIKKYQQILIDGFGGIVAAVISIIVCVGISWKFFLFSILCLPVMILLGTFLHTKLEKAAYEKQIAIGNSNTELLNSIQNVECIKAYSIEDYMVKKYDGTLMEEKKAAIKDAAVRGLAAGLNRIVGALPYLVLFSTGAVLIWRGEIRLGEFFSFSYIFSNVQSIQNLFDILSARKSCKASEKRMMDLLEIPQHESSEEPVCEIKAEDGLYMKNVTFSYESSHSVLENITAHFRFGEITAVVGESGAGKSTLFKLLAGLLNPEDGSICLVEKGKCYGENKYKEQMAVVFQDNYLFPGTIKDNLQVGYPDASEEELQDACKNVGIWDDIQNMERGMDTKVQEMGCSLSGGQQQRLCIARALIRNPRILILDEPSASLDSKHEKELMGLLKREAKDRIVLLISHRESTIRYADAVFVLKNKTLERN